MTGGAKKDLLRGKTKKGEGRTLKPLLGLREKGTARTHLRKGDGGKREWFSRGSKKKELCRGEGMLDRKHAHKREADH